MQWTVDLTKICATVKNTTGDLELPMLNQKQCFVLQTYLIYHNARKLHAKHIYICVYLLCHKATKNQQDFGMQTIFSNMKP